MLKQLTPESTFGHYRIRSKIGAGGMGEVYLAEDTKLGRQVALKVLREELSNDEDKLNRFVREAKTASALNHPNILTVYEIGETEGVSYIATEYIDGMTLRDRLSHSRLGLPEALNIAIQVGEALAAAHRAGIIHRDIKPENVMLRSDGYAKVLDFGLAKLLEGGPSPDSGERFETTPGLIMGTVAYMSPEQARGQVLDARSDVFSFGTLFYEMLSGKQPFAGETPSHSLVAILEHAPEPLPHTGYPVDEDLNRIANKALAKHAHERYDSAADLAAEISRIRRKVDADAPHREAVMNADTVLLGAVSAAPTDGTTIAVLPFVNMSRNEDGDYFSDGLAEELLNVLSKIRGLRVAARTSAFSFKDKRATITEIGRTLNVASILEGSIRIANERIRIAVQLIKTSDGYRLWSETYDRTMDDIFAIQDDIAESVVGELRVRLLGEPKGKNTAGRVVDEIADAVRGRAEAPEAQRLMLLGRHFLDRTTPEDTKKAIDYFLQALKIDPGHAAGWAELSRAYAVEAGKAWVPVGEGYERSREAAARSLSIEPELAEAHAQMGRIASAYDLDMAAARDSYSRALALAPGSSVVMDGASILELKFGNYDKALDMSRQVLAQDPLSASVWHNLGLICHSAGLLDEAEQAMRRALELTQRRGVTAAMLALIVLDKGHAEDALITAELEADKFWRSWARSIIFSRTNRMEEAQAEFKNLHANDGDAYQMAELHAVRNEADLAFEWLERALTRRDPGVTHAKASPRLRSLESDVRWLPFLERLGLKD